MARSRSSSSTTAMTPRFAGFAGIVGDLVGIFTPEDMAALGADLPVNTSALAVLFEHRWAES